MHTYRVVFVFSKRIFEHSELFIKKYSLNKQIPFKEKQLVLPYKK